MPAPARHGLILLLGALALIARPAAAGESLRFFTQPLVIPERGAVTSCVLLLGTNRFSFLPPPDYRVVCDENAKTVTLEPPDLGAGLHFKLVLDPRQTGQPLAAEALRLQVAERFPGGKIANEFNCFTSGREGTGFDIEYTGAKKIKMVTRLAFVPFPGGLVEFNLTTTEKRFASYHIPFGNLLTSFRIERAPAEK